MGFMNYAAKLVPVSTRNVQAAQCSMLNILSFIGAVQSRHSQFSLFPTDRTLV